MTTTETSTEQYDALRGLLDERWTCRQFLSTPVPHDTIARVLTLAQRTPSWCNSQAWQVVVTEGEATEGFRKGLAAYIQANPTAPDFEFPAAYTGVYRERRRECAFELYDSVGIAMGDRAASFVQTLRNFELFDAPHVAIVTTEADLGVYGAVDCGLYVNTFLLGAQSLGLAAAAQAALASYAPFIREHFDLPDNRRVVVGVSFGYPDLDHPVNNFRTSRADLDEVVTWRS